jgi:hypothetical protein
MKVENEKEKGEREKYKENKGTQGRQEKVKKKTERKNKRI